VAALTLPLTALACVDRVITELGVFDPKGDHFHCVERAEGITEAVVTARTGAPVRF
jgi:acyl CoA:acetate/3-ketoacid CoA transferase beta subunit